jgi:hypothetical protein
MHSHAEQAANAPMAAKMRAADAEPEAALSPTLIAWADALTPFHRTRDAAMTGARTLLAAHARELADLVQQRISVDRADNPGGGQLAARNHTRRGGMMTARWVLDRYADDLEQQAASGEQA